MHILDLPYDIRHLVYQHLFPRGEQIYIAATQNSLRAIIPEGKVPIELLFTSRTIYAEASEYLYNSYLFNIIGTKRNCLANYSSFLSALQDHARNEVHVDAFSNGSHSATMCLSFHAGEARVALLKRRERGEPTTIRELETELAITANPEPSATWRCFQSRSLIRLFAAAGFILVAGLSIWLRRMWH